MKKIKIYSLFFGIFFALTALTPRAAASSSQLVDEMQVNAGAAMLVDLDTDCVLFGQDEAKQIYPASTTKILTALIILQDVEDGKLSLEDTVTCSDTFQETLTASAAVVGLQADEQMSVEDLLYCLLLPSACDAANVLAEADAGSIDKFADKMNQTAQALGCTKSHFVNPSGLHDDEHYTTCQDLYRITKAAMGYDEFRHIVATPSYTVSATNFSEERKLKNTNALLQGTKSSTYHYPGCIGIKTGSTYLAGNCLISAAQREEQTLVCIMMGCNWLINLDGSRDKLQFSESIRLYDWGFENFSTVPVLEAGDVVTSLSVRDAEEGTDHVNAVAADAVYAEIPKDVSAEDFEQQVTCDKTLEAPVTAGDVVGNVTLLLDGKTYGTVDLVAANDVALSEAKVKEQQREQWMAKYGWIFQAVGLGVLLLVVVYLLLVIRAQTIRRLRRKRKQTQRRHRSRK